MKPVPMHPGLADYLKEWRSVTPYCEGDNSRFGWHNLRHSLATFFGANDVHPSVIQTMLRHSKQQTTLRYIHAVNDKQVEAQGLYLDAIEMRGKHMQASSVGVSRVESRVGGERSKSVSA
jgi:integrase